MSAATENKKTRATGSRVLAPPSKTGDAMFKGLTWCMAMMVFALVIIVGWELFQGAGPSLRKFGWGFLARSDWPPASENFGAAPFILGTLVSSLLGLALALPVSLATAVYLTELAPRWVRQPALSLIELLTAIPSVIFGLWGMVVLVPWLKDHPFAYLQKFLGFLPLFGGHIYGPCVLSAAAIIAIMIVPIITSITREVLRAVPDSRREAAFALGATRWEVTRLAVLRGSGRGIFGAAMLGLGRALGEAIAVGMVIGNSTELSASLFAPGSTLASGIVNKFSEATDDLYRGALFELGLALLLVTVVTNVLAHLLIGAVGAPKHTRPV
jgi:phosphate transport system permease protein